MFFDYTRVLNLKYMRLTILTESVNEQFQPKIKSGQFVCVIVINIIA